MAKLNFGEKVNNETVFFVNVMATLVDGKKMTNEKKQELMEDAPNSVRVLIVDSTDESNVLVDKVVGVDVSKAGSVGYFYKDSGFEFGAGSDDS